jgi:hypoxanthine-guanine phosphoribosyltransferase
MGYVPDTFVVGYGLDHDRRCPNLSHHSLIK